ncbi:MAG: DegT/DnrJ/EryC1/StrS family aminotransferase [Finegoldia magna]|uniref:DegT/DnrJ/EryC1/StrS family aminotransferase n=1 Tax=Finegoldia magna TaxID=1260 RepID=A0A943LCP5_FINMA|nr:DegT/DnrJ/EryC1/StrS family aminotransferase [Finegoldia magna]MBS5964991.1 DegT/DnrJ/EryC1/StrS family aminotransferase [Finegoldia magna]
MSINVTQPSMPDYEEYCEIIKGIWENKHLTNNGPLHQQLEDKLIDYLKVGNVSLATNGHLALEIAIAALELKGEVITTPYTFISTTQAIKRNGLVPIFCDINEEDFTIDVNKIESLITEKTSAILPVHVYGNICDVDKIEEIAKKYNLKVIYDAAHAFGVEYNDIGVGNFGNVSMFSFHATKVFNTVEGGALSYNDAGLYEKIKSLKNFGINKDNSIEYIAGNAKMDEFRAAMGIANLKNINENIAKRELIFKRYLDKLKAVEGISLIKYREGLKPNYSYFPIVVDKEKYGVSRDMLFNRLKGNGINTRKYFYPSINVSKPYFEKNYKQNTPIAYNISQNVMCLPMYSDLSLSEVDYICDTITKNGD